MSLTVNRHLLPEAEAERNELLKKYFCELPASASSAGETWSIHLCRPNNADFYVDPDLNRGLEWWSRHFSEISVPEIPLAFHRTRGWQLSLNDSWTLYSWSRWLQDSHITSDTAGTVTVLHLDDHDDLMTPRVLIDAGNGFRDLISGALIDLQQPETVAAGVTSGAIGIGSFMAPLLHRFPMVQVRHLCSTEYTDARKGPHIVCPVDVADELLAPGSIRPGLRLDKLQDSRDKTRVRGSHPYMVTDDLSAWLNNLPAGPVLLHIDMDYFNNRFNGDSDWVDEGPKYDPPLEQVLARIDRVFQSLEDAGVAERVNDFAAALSPGFFPADLWEPSIARIESHVKRLLAEGRWTSRK
jgi:hypothetical protein